MTDSENLLIGDIVISVVRSPRRRRLTLEVSERGGVSQSTAAYAASALLWSLCRPNRIG